MFVEADSSLDLTLGASIGANAPTSDDASAALPRSSDGEQPAEKNPQQVLVEKKVNEVLGSEVSRASHADTLERQDSRKTNTR